MHNTNIFDEYAEFYGNTSPHSYDYFFLNFIIKSNASLLDIGGGSGTFAILAKDIYPNMDIVVIDPSQKLLDRINDKRIKTYRGSLPNNICFNEDSSFDYIHIKEVLHHIVGHSVSESEIIVRNSLINLRKKLKDDGFIFIHELFYESYLVPSLSRTFIFNILKFQMNFKLRLLPKEFLMGLVVCFYTRDEFKKILNECGYELVGYHEELWENSIKKKALLLKNWGRMLFIARKINISN